VTDGSEAAPSALDGNETSQLAIKQTCRRRLEVNYQWHFWRRPKTERQQALRLRTEPQADANRYNALRGDVVFRPIPEYSGPLNSDSTATRPKSVTRR
jgi:hypothetical protein